MTDAEQTEEKTPPILSELTFRVKGAYIEIKAIGKRLDSAMCDDIIKMVEAQKDALTD